jgi:hypothetical protein
MAMMPSTNRISTSVKPDCLLREIENMGTPLGE